MAKLVVLKFGGSSVGGAERMKRVANIVFGAKSKSQVIVVVSALSKVTDLLMSAAMHASHNNRSGLDRDLEGIITLHDVTVRDLALSESKTEALEKAVEKLVTELSQLLESILNLGELTPRILDLVLSFGERLSVELVAATLDNASVAAKPLSATTLIVTDDNFGIAQPLLNKSEAKSRPVLKKLLADNIVPVVTGFVGATEQGITTTLGRGGSDYTATILGYCLGADEVQIWTDVDGAMTADPRILSDAKTIPTLSYGEAAEIAYFGAKVLHPLTMMPASLKNIPIHIKNTLNPRAVGTRITSKSRFTKSRVKAISVLKSVSIIVVQGKGLSGVPGMAAKVFGAIAAEKINVLFISQASSEYNISIVVRSDDSERAVAALNKVFDTDLDRHLVEGIFLEDSMAITAIVGDGMKGYAGIAGKAFHGLGTAGVNIAAIDCPRILRPKYIFCHH
jgi:aspartokinase/homoserine dehydrogenase 1